MKMSEKKIPKFEDSLETTEVKEKFNFPRKHGKKRKFFESFFFFFSFAFLGTLRLAFTEAESFYAGCRWLWIIDIIPSLSTAEAALVLCRVFISIFLRLCMEYAKQEIKFCDNFFLPAWRGTQSPTFSFRTIRKSRENIHNFLFHFISFERRGFSAMVQLFPFFYQLDDLNFILRMKMKI